LYGRGQKTLEVEPNSTGQGGKVRLQRLKNCKGQEGIVTKIAAPWVETRGDQEPLLPTGVKLYVEHCMNTDPELRTKRRNCLIKWKNQKSSKREGEGRGWHNETNKEPANAWGRTNRGSLSETKKPSQKGKLDS